MKKIFFLSLVALSLAACKKGDDNPQVITYNLAVGAWSTETTNMNVQYIVNNDTVTANNLSSNYRDEIGPLKEGDAFSLTVTNNAPGTHTIGADIFIMKCVDGQCSDYMPVIQNRSTNNTVTASGTIQDPTQ